MRCRSVEAVLNVIWRVCESRLCVYCVCVFVGESVGGWEGVGGLLLVSHTGE